MAGEFVAVIRHTDIMPATRQYSGLPPGLLPGVGGQEPMPVASLLVIETREDGTFLLRYSRDGLFAGDTWHGNVEEAKEQAAEEYESLLSDWRQVPPGVEDLVGFAKGLLG